RGKLYGESEAPDALEAGRVMNLHPVNYSKDLVRCPEGTPIKELAQTMVQQHVGCILIDRKGLSVGIVTDKDLREKVATGLFPITATAETLMSSPLVTDPMNLTVTQAHLAMMKSNISHLVLTQDGTPDSPAKGIISKHDLILALGNNPLVLMRAIKRARGTKDLRRARQGIQLLLQGYLEQNIPMGLVSKIISELNDATIKQVVRLSLKKMESPPPVKFAWLSMGSQGRGEQLLNTDQDNAIVYQDVPQEGGQAARTYFLELGSRISEGLNFIGFEYCPAEMMASNPLWCHSLGEWKEVTDHWMGNPGPD